jgi:hypothetical protein
MCSVAGHGTLICAFGCRKSIPKTVTTQGHAHKPMQHVQAHICQAATCRRVRPRAHSRAALSIGAAPQQPGAKLTTEVPASKAVELCMHGRVMSGGAVSEPLWERLRAMQVRHPAVAESNTMPQNCMHSCVLCLISIQPADNDTGDRRGSMFGGSVRLKWSESGFNQGLPGPSYSRAAFAGAGPNRMAVAARQSTRQRTLGREAIFCWLQSLLCDRAGISCLTTSANAAKKNRRWSPSSHISVHGAGYDLGFVETVLNSFAPQFNFCCEASAARHV